MSVTKTRTYSVSIPEQTFDDLKDIEKSLGLNRDVVIGAITEYIRALPNTEVMKIAEIGIKQQSALLLAKSKNGGFFSKQETVQQATTTPPKSGNTPDNKK